MTSQIYSGIFLVFLLKLHRMFFFGEIKKEPKNIFAPGEKFRENARLIHENFGEAFSG